MAVAALLAFPIEHSCAALTVCYDMNGNTLSQQAAVATALPEITTHPHNVLLIPGGSARFSVVAAGPAPLTYQWQHNGVDLPDEATDALVISGLPIDLADYGQYRVIVTNANGSVTSSPATVLPDVDEDGMADAWELLHLGDLAQTADGDFDGDRVSNLDEFREGSDPTAHTHYLTNGSRWFEYEQGAAHAWQFNISPGAPFSFAAHASGAPTSYAINQLPTGLQFDTATGLLSGTPLTTGGFDLQLTAQTSFGTMSGRLDLNVLSVFGWGTLAGSAPPPDLNDVHQVEAGTDFGVALLYDGTVAGWGSLAVPAGLLDVVQLSASVDHVLALKTDGTVEAWPGAAGKTAVPAGLADVVQVAAGGLFSAALKNDGTVVTWGNSGVNVPTGLANVVEIAAGHWHILARLGDGSVVAWGDDREGQATVPAGLAEVVAVAAGGDHSLALKSDGTVVAWGKNGDGTVGGGGQIDVPAGLTDVVAIAGGNTHSYALKSDGSAVGWGSTGAGQRDTPGGHGGFARLSAGLASTFGLSRYGTTLAPEIVADRFAIGISGFPFHLRVPTKNFPTSFAATGLPAGLGIDPATGLISGTPTVTGTFPVALSATNAEGTDTADLTLTFYETAVNITSGSSLNLNPATAANYQITANYPVSTHAATGLPAGLSVDPATGLISGTPEVTGNFSAEITAMTTLGIATSTLDIRIRPVIGWGQNVASRNAPYGPEAIRAIDVGSDGLALSQIGAVTAWGANSSVPAGVVDAVGVSAGGGHSFALLEDQTVIGWGSNIWGELNGFGNITNAVDVSTGADHTIVLRSFGGVRVRGKNNLGESTSPSGLRDVVAVSLGNATSYAALADGSVVVWGAGFDGQTNPPPEVADVVSLAAGDNHCVALRRDGTVVAWGRNNNGQTNVPAGLTDVVAVAAGGNHSAALKADGTVVAWGSNSHGQLNTPSYVGPLLDIAATGNVTLGLSAKDSGVPLIAAKRFATATAHYPLWIRVPATDSPTSFGATGLPPGVGIDATTGMITGTPTATGAFDVSLTATNASGSGHADLQIFINAPVPEITSATILDATTRTQIAYQITANVPVATYGASGLPAGLALDPATGIVSGQAPVGVFPIGLDIGSAYGTATGTLTLTVTPSPYDLWLTAYPQLGTPAEQDPLATPFDDEVPNLLKFAFGMDGGSPDSHSMIAGTGTSGLPILTRTTVAGQDVLRAEFVRRLDSSLVYEPRWSDSLGQESWIPFVSAPTVTAIDSNWERVVYEEPVAGMLRVFGRVAVSLQ